MKNILLSHGGGGEEMNELINELIFKYFDNEILKETNDSAILKIDGEIAFSTDSYVVTPIFFSGGDIGKISVCGTINDLCMVGAKPLYLSVGFIIEEGLSFDEFEKILSSMSKIAKENDVKIVCGDTKVVPKGKCDKIFINTSGIGKIIHKIETKNIKNRAKILISGDIARHGSVIVAARDEINLESDLKSDCRSLKDIVMALFENNIYPQAMRDATRGGLSAVLNEWANFNKIEILLNEESIKVQDEVMGICELLGFEPYDLANEGTFVLAIDEKDSKKALEILKNFNENASIIGEVISDKNSRVILKNPYGVKRFLEYPKGELLPRIC
ncbi:hydrogenase expression/formation protein HypE [Campylobacter blaseri]|uniref:Hydrogenase expression/formation protein HypE n=1 Tax=Campylobacter blaseri TaxID=2042961 RepID=A0A2P8QYU8_9BACT|nr:hydrogenase expression/formation protein HypE [Campylobacter blaseri]PSM51407.1 hydrogenase expression/formation protein HypE [Campylobacter blaseri]PSM52857.1 hydrogenase expression/formation protein HypE [Campylobacter blaseri]QKF86160.1 hydrogenase expression/formation protein HypE [Campylobacter blaseri]